MTFSDKYAHILITQHSVPLKNNTGEIIYKYIYTHSLIRKVLFKEICMDDIMINMGLHRTP